MLRLHRTKNKPTYKCSIVNCPEKNGEAKNYIKISKRYISEPSPTMLHLINPDMFNFAGA